MKIEWKSNTLNLKSQQKYIHYYTNSIENGKSNLVFLHGHSDNGLCWDRVAAEFVKHYNIFLVDAPNHGNSSDFITKSKDIKNRNYVANPLIFTLKEFIEQLKITKPILIGHSMGASQASFFGNLYPELISALYLEDPREIAFHNSQLRMFEIRINAFIERRFMKPVSSEVLYERIHKKNPTWEDIDIEPWILSKLLWKNHNRYQVQRMFALMRFDMGLYNDLKCPTRIVSSDGGILSQITARKIIKKNSKITWCFIKNTGHAIRRESYETFLKDFKDFLFELQ